MVEADIALVSDSVIRRRLLYVRVSAENETNQRAHASIQVQRAMTSASDVAHRVELGVR
jgi:hypothetical protein